MPGCGSGTWPAWQRKSPASTRPRGVPLKGGSPPASLLDPDSSWLYSMPEGCSNWGRGSGLMGVVKVLTQGLMGIVVHTPPRANGSCSSHPLGLMGIAVYAQGTTVNRPGERERRPNHSSVPTFPTSSPPPPPLGPVLASASFPDGCVCIFFSFFAFFFFPLFYYCFNNNKRARGRQALVRSWRPMGVLGRGRGEASGGQRWRVKKEQVGELGLAQETCVPVHLPPSLPHPHPPASPPPCLYRASHPLSQSPMGQDPPPVCLLLARSFSWTLSPPTFSFSSSRGQPAINLQSCFP